MMLFLGIGFGAVATYVLLTLSRRRPNRLGNESRENLQSIDALDELDADDLEPGMSARLAVLSERERIYRDLHDDIGSKLLTLVHSAEGTPQASIAREVLQDMRAVIAGAYGADGTLEELLEGICDEATQRLEIADCTLNWEQDISSPTAVVIEAKALHLQRIVREAVTNALRHSPAERLRIRVRETDSELLVDVTDDAPEFVPPNQQGQGRGTANMQERAQQLHGQIHWDAGSLGGTKVLLRVPLAELIEHPPM